MHRAYTRAARAARTNRAIYRLLFGHWPAPQAQGQLWDWTTLALASALRRHVRPGASVLDMGTGPAGVLAVYSKRQLRCGRAYGVDHLPDLLLSAAATAAGCGAAVGFLCGALFSAVRGRFDVIAFNAPYIRVDDGWRLGALRDATEERRWSGGPTGLETIERFLGEAPSHLTASGHILLGVNHFYVDPEAVRRALLSAGLEELETVPHRLTQACAYVLRPRAQLR